MNVDRAKQAIHNPVSSVLLWILSSGSLGTAVTAIWSGLSMANDLENQTIRADERQKVIIEQQAVMVNDLKDAKKQQQDIRELLIEIKTKMENQ